jgi:hypothetical protein
METAAETEQAAPAFEINSETKSISIEISK